MIKPPGRKVPVRPVPESAQKEYDQHVPHVYRRSPPAPAQRNIHIIREPGRERDVPPTPEVPDTVSQIRTVEIDMQTDSEKPRSAQRDIRVAGKIRIDLESEQYSGKDRERAAVPVRVKERGHV